MKKAICLFLSICVCFSLSCCAASKTVSFSDDSKAMQEASNSVIMLSCYDKNGELYATGSAFAAFEEGVFITNCHVIKGEVYSIKAQMETGLEFNISSVVAYDEERDLAILRTEAKTGLEPLPLGKSSNMEKGEKVIAIGSPLGLINTLSVGLYSGTIREEQTFLQFSAAISHGSSGGALFNNKGEVIGITSASFTEGQNLNLAIPIEDAITMWEKRSKELSLKEFYDEWNTVVSTTVSYVVSHRNEFKGQEIQISGYLYTYNGDYYLVSSEEEIKRLEYLYSYFNSLVDATGDNASAIEQLLEKRANENKKEHDQILKNSSIILHVDKKEIQRFNQGEHIIVQGCLSGTLLLGSWNKYAVVVG